MFLTPNLTTKAKQLQLVNGFVQQHDYLCCCKNPTFHCLQILTTQLAPELKESEKQQIQKCLTTTKETTTAAGEEDLGVEDLEKLFATDLTEDDTG